MNARVSQGFWKVGSRVLSEKDMTPLNLVQEYQREQIVAHIVGQLTQGMKQHFTDVLTPP